MNRVIRKKTTGAGSPIAITLALVTDCAGTDEGRYLLAIGRAFFPQTPTVAFFPTASMQPLHSGFIAAAHALSTIDLFGQLRPRERVGVLVNAARRHGQENGHHLRGAQRKKSGEEVYALELKNGLWIVGPNAGMNFYLLPRNQIAHSYILGGPRLKTPFRSMELMVPALAQALGANNFKDISFTPKRLTIPEPEPGVFVGDWDSHGNIYIFSTLPDKEWLPALGKRITVNINGRGARLRHVNGIFAGRTGEVTLTVGSLKLNDSNVHYIVVVGGDAHGLFGRPPVGARVAIED